MSNNDEKKLFQQVVHWNRIETWKKNTYTKKNDSNEMCVNTSACDILFLHLSKR